MKYESQGPLRFKTLLEYANLTGSSVEQFCYQKCQNFTTEKKRKTDVLVVSAKNWNRVLKFHAEKFRSLSKKKILNRIQAKIVSILDVQLEDQFYNVDADLRAYTSCFS